MTATAPRPTPPASTPDPAPDPTLAGAGLPIATGAVTARDLWHRTRHHRGLATGTVLILVLATLAALAIPLLLGAVVDVVARNRPSDQLPWIIAGLVAATLAQGVLYGLGAWGVGRLGELVMADLRESVVERALAVPVADVEQAGTGDLVARACSDVDAVSEAMRDAIPETVGPALLIALTIVGLATLDWRLALAGLAAAPIQIFAARWYLRRSRPIYRAERVAEGARSQRLHASVTGARTVRALRLGGTHGEAIVGSSRRAVDLAISASSVRARFFSMLNAAELLGLSVVLLVSFPLVRDGSITVGAATAAALYFYRLFDPIGALLSELDTVQSAGAALARLVGVTTLPAPAERARTVEHAPSLGVRLAGVSFAYDPARVVLHDVDLVVRAGERVALVGPSGAGKTTVAKLVAGIHEAGRGRVEVGGVDVRELDRAQLARLVTLVTQEVHVFAGPLRADLHLARPDADDPQLRAALERVGARGWVDLLPDGLDTVVGDGGHRLSPTEAQQLALARLVLADPAIAVLDEATAEAGSAGATVLEAAATEAVAGRTAIVIAHRLTQAATADRVVVLERGRVVEDGTHDELLAGGGVYAELWAAWSADRAH